METAATGESQDSSRYESIFTNFHNFDTTTANNNNNNNLDREPVRLIHNNNNSNNNNESNLAILDLVQFFMTNSSTSRNISSTEKTSTNQTLTEKREHLNQLLRQLNQFQPTPVEFSTEQSALTTTPPIDPLPMSTKKPPTPTDNFEMNQRDRYSSYFPEYGDDSEENIPIDLKAVLSKEFASYNLSAFYDPYNTDTKVEMTNDAVEENVKNEIDKMTPDSNPQYADVTYEDDSSESSEMRQKQGDILTNDEQRLALPLVGINSASKISQLDPATLQEGADTINIVVSPTFEVDNGEVAGGDISIFPQSQMSRLRSNITDLTGLDVDRLVEEVSAVVGKIDAPLRVEEQHTQITRHEGLPPKYKYTETTAQVLPSDDPQDPFIKVLSKKVQDGEIKGELGDLIGGGPTSRVEAGSASDDVRVNVTTKTNIVNIFTFNIFLSNDTGKNFSLNRVSPFKTKIETTATVDAGPSQNTVSVYKYEADEEGKMGKKKQNGGATPELEKWLKILLKHQVSGKRGEGSLLQEAILKDASLLQIPSGDFDDRNRPFYRKVDEKEVDETTTPKNEVVTFSSTKTTTSASNNIGPLGFTVSETTTAEPSAMSIDGMIKFVESMGIGAIPTFFAGAIATYPFWMPLLAGGRKRRRKRESSSKVDIPENWLAYLLGTRFGQNAKMSKMKTSTPTTTMSTMQEPFVTTTSFVESTVEGIETGRTLSKEFYPTTTVTTVKQQGFNSVHISKMRIPGSPILPRPTSADITFPTPPTPSTRPLSKTHLLMDKWAEMFNSKKEKNNSSTGTTPLFTTSRPLSLSDLTLETDSNEVTLPTNWKPSLQPYMTTLKEKEGSTKDEESSSSSTPLIIGSDVAVSSSTITEINFEPGKNAPLYTGVKSTDIPPNVWLTAQDIISGLGQTEFDNQTESIPPGLEIKFEDNEEDSQIKPHKFVSLDGNEESQVDLVVLKKPENSSESALDSIPIVIPGLPIPTKSQWKRRPTVSSFKRQPSPSKLFIQSFLKSYNKTDEPLKPVTLSSFTQQQMKLAEQKKSTNETITTKVEQTSEPPKYIVRPVTLEAFSIDKFKNSLITKGNTKENLIPKEVVVNSHSIQTHLTPEIASNIIRNQIAETFTRPTEELTTTTTSTPTTTSSFTTTDDSDLVEMHKNKYPFGSDIPADIDPSDVLKLAYGGSFNIFGSDDDQERAIDRLIQQLEREYNNSLNNNSPNNNNNNNSETKRASSSSDIETGGKSAQIKKQQSEEHAFTTSKWVYLSGVDKTPTPSASPTGLTPTASNDEILDLIKNMEREVTQKNQTLSPSIFVDVTETKDDDLMLQNTDDVTASNESVELHNMEEAVTESNEPEIIYLNDETIKHFMDEMSDKNVPLKESENDQEPEINGDQIDGTLANTLEQFLSIDYGSYAADTPPVPTTLIPLETTATTTTTTTSDVIDQDSITEDTNETPPFPQGPLFVRAGSDTTSTTTTTTEAPTTTTSAPTAVEIFANVISQSAAPLAGLSAASLAYGAAAMLPLWLPLALGKKRRKRREFELKKRSEENVFLRRLLLSEQESFKY